MEIRVTESYNAILKRKELALFMDHTSRSTPRLYEVRKSLAEKYNVEEDTVYVIRLDTKTGTNRTYGKAEIYDSSEIAKNIVPKHIQIRNTSSRREKEKT